MNSTQTKPNRTSKHLSKRWAWVQHCIFLAVAVLATSSNAQTNRTWTGGTNTTWNTPGNWTGGVPDTIAEVALFNAATTNDPASFGTAITIGGFNLTGGESRILTFTNTIALNQYGVDNASTFDLTILGAGTTTLTAAQTWAITNTGNTTFSKALANGGFLLTLEATSSGVGLIDGAISGTGGITKSGAGSWTLSNASNSYSGTNTITGGSLILGTNNALGSGAVTVNGGTLDIAGFNDTVGVVTLTSGSITGSGGTLTGSSYTLNNTTATSITAILGGAGAMTKTGAGTATLSGANTYTGLISVDVGTLRATTSANALGTGAASLGLGGGTLELANDTGLAFDRNTTVTASSTIKSDVLTPSGPGVTHTLGTLTLTTGTLTITKGDNVGSGVAGLTFGAVTSGNNANVIAPGAGTLVTIASFGTGGNREFRVDGAGDLTVTGTVGIGNRPLLKSGSGTLTLNGTSTSTADSTQPGGGWVVSGGVLRLNNAGALPTTAGLTLNGGVLGLGSGNFTRALGATAATANTIRWTGSGGFAAYTADRNVNLGGASATVTWNTGGFVPTGSSLILGAADADKTVTFQNPIALAGAAHTVQVNNGSASVDASLSGILSGTGSSGLTKTGNGTLTLTNTNTYVGVTTINAGVLSVGTIGNGGVAGNLGQATSAAANLVLGGGALQYTGSTASTDRAFTLTAGTTSSIEVENSGTALTISGASANTNGALNKTGAGKLILSGANAYTGLTDVQAGTLEYGVNNALSSGAVQVSGGKLDLKTFNDTVGAVTLTSGSIDSTTGILTGTSYAMQSGSVSAILGGTAALTKTTGGTVTLSGANTYSGSTSLTTGTLLIDNTSGSATGTGSVTTNSGTFLAGSGRIAPGSGNAINMNGTLIVGQDGIGPARDFDIALSNAATTLTSTSVIKMDLFNGYNSSTLNGSSSADLLNFSGLLGTTSVAINGALTFDFVGGIPTITAANWTSGSSWQLFAWSGLSSVTGSFTSVNGLPDLTPLALDWDDTALYTTGVLSIIAIPEPRMTSLIWLGLLATQMRRRRSSPKAQL